MVWENYESANAAVFGAFSRDGGITWSVPLRIADSFNLDLTPAMAIDSRDMVFLTWSMYGWPATLFGRIFQL